VAAIAPGNVDRGKAVFATTCAGCHGDLGAGGSVGPKLAGAGLTAAIVQARIDGGAGVMPAGLVHGGREADVIAYVVGLGGAK
jgi:mono/diheme cytochrome c family protein